MRCLNRFLRGKAFLFLLAMTALLAPASLMGQTELTVYDGQNTNGLVPYSYEYRTEWQKCEFVIPASALADMGATAQVPKLISEMTFYYSWYGYDPLFYGWGGWYSPYWGRHYGYYGYGYYGWGLPSYHVSYGNSS